MRLQGVGQPLRVTRQYAFNCAKLPLEVYFIGGELGSSSTDVFLDVGANIGWSREIVLRTSRPVAPTLARIIVPWY